VAWFPRLGIRKAGEIHINKSRNSILSNSNALSICPSTDEWMKKVWYIHTMKYYSSIKKNEITPFAAPWVGLEIIKLSGFRQRKTSVI